MPSSEQDGTGADARGGADAGGGASSGGGVGAGGGAGAVFIYIVTFLLMHTCNFLKCIFYLLHYILHINISVLLYSYNKNNYYIRFTILFVPSCLDGSSSLLSPKTTPLRILFGLLGHCILRKLN